MLTIFTETISPRLTYVVEAIFEDILGVSVHLTQEEHLIEPDTVCLNYSMKDLYDMSFIRPHSLLFEQGVRQVTEAMDSQGILFPRESDIVEQDIFAAAFFLLSRYEEYSDTELDPHGRQLAKNSKMYKAGLLAHPLVDQWALALYDKLRIRYPKLPEPQRTFTLLPTFDIDVAFAFKGRGGLRQFGTSAKDLISLDFKRMRARKGVLKGDELDPYDSYEYQRAICEELGVSSRHFFLLGDRGPLDRSLSHSNEALIGLIKEISTWSSAGIHPSMASNSREGRLKKEIGRLKKILGSEVSQSRQHYLYLDLPTTYQRLIELGITEDYTMGYADHIGFRAGTCSAFRWYDLSLEYTSPLYLIPISVMDSTLKDYMGLSPEKAIATLGSIRHSIESVQGLFVMLWHNHTVSNQGDWFGWRKVFEHGLRG